jgi:hypothetical protein
MKGITMKKLIILIGVCWLISACSPGVGSERWCENLEKKSKGEWTANEAKDYAKHCIFK